MLFRTLPILLLTIFIASCTQPLRKRSILVIGDSNGAAADGWVAQLQDIRKGGPLVNTSLGYNTFGFSDDGVNRNTLENLTPYLRKGYADMGQIDEIIIGLGTNDCKAKYADRHGEIDDHLETLLTRTRDFFTERGQELPRVVLLTPPPIAGDDTVSEEFRGAKECTANLSRDIRRIANREGYCVVDLQLNPGDAALLHSEDGIHFDERGYEMLAKSIVRSCY